MIHESNVSVFFLFFKTSTKHVTTYKVKGAVVFGAAVYKYKYL